MSTKIAYCGENRNATRKNTSDSAVSLDKLAQLGTDNDFDLSAHTDSKDKKTLIKRARRNYFSTGLAIGLVNSARHNQDSFLTKSYWRTYHCAGSLSLYKSGKITGKYCKCRWCLVCNAIRTAIAINTYSPVLDTWEDAHFVTLTQRTVSAENLKEQLDSMQSIFKAICENSKRKFQRGKCSFRLVGVKKLECTYRPQSNRYHPHFHIITETAEMAKVLHDQWVVRNPTAMVEGQDVRRADKGSYKELFKYMTKVIASTGKRMTKDDKREIHTSSLDIIFNAMHRRRTLQNFGFRLPKETNVSASDIDVEELQSILEWHQEVSDWVDVNTGELLTGYTPAPAMRKLVEGVARTKA